MGEEESKQKNKRCCISTKESIYSKRCFITGEYCSHQTNIHKEKIKLYDDPEGPCINAFIIMNFSDMSDVVYEWRIKPFIESLDRHLYMNKDHTKLYCYEKTLENSFEKENQLDKVKKINVLRADSDYSSNYVICNRICQQMQIADLVIVDVSSQNANVFYEFGMAVAFGKLILPICYSESFYKMDFPTDPQRYAEFLKIQKYIGWFPWRKNLYEHFGIRYKTEKSEVRYLSYEDINKYESKGISLVDNKYLKFPYDKKIINDESQEELVGKRIYEKLEDGYNNSDNKFNTLVIYTMDSFLNKNEAGLCIINFYKNITECMRDEHCFSGERVGVLAEENSIYEEDKDADDKLNILYSVSEIIHIGVNQATYYAERNRVKAEEVLEIDKKILSGKDEFECISPRQREDIVKFAKQFIRNKGILIYPSDPIYVDRIKDTEDLKNIFNETKTGESPFCCLYHIMLRTLKYTNEIVVDISNNSLQSLFWLGAAHAEGVNAITVKYEMSDKERMENNAKEKRNIFDVAGLWTAVFHKNDTKEFYKNLVSVQRGIEYNSKLILPEQVRMHKKISDSLYYNEDSSKIDDILSDQRNLQDEVLESFYRNRFWKPMLHYNTLELYLAEKIEYHKDSEDEISSIPRSYVSRWDHAAVAALSKYLSKRKLIGEYSIITISDNELLNSQNEELVNFISIGADVKPFNDNTGRSTLIDHIINEYKDNHNIWKGNQDKKIPYKVKGDISIDKCYKNKSLYTKGFVPYDSNEDSESVSTAHPSIDCLHCLTNREDNNCDIHINYYDEKKNRINHKEIAQLLLWKDQKHKGNGEDEDYFAVSLIGSSGPGSYGLTSLFIDQEQRKNQLGIENFGEKFLVKIQKDVRKVFIATVDKKINEACDRVFDTIPEDYQEEGEKEKRRRDKYKKIVQSSINYYLISILYRYFLPFVTEKHINRIYNGVKMYLEFMLANEVTPFSLNYNYKDHQLFRMKMQKDTILAIIDEIPKIVRDCLKNFKGIQAFCTISVDISSRDSSRDTRKVTKVELYNFGTKDEEKYVDCYFDNKKYSDPL